MAEATRAKSTGIAVCALAVLQLAWASGTAAQPLLPPLPPLPGSAGAPILDAGTMSSLAADETGWLRRVYFIVGQAVFSVAGYTPHGTYSLRFVVTPAGRGTRFQLLGFRGRGKDYAAIVAAVAAAQFPPPPGGAPLAVTYDAVP